MFAGEPLLPEIVIYRCYMLLRCTRRYMVLARGMLPKALDELEKGHQAQAHESDAQTAKMSEKSGGMSTSASAPNYYYYKKKLKRVHL